MTTQQPVFEHSYFPDKEYRLHGVSALFFHRDYYFTELNKVLAGFGNEELAYFHTLRIFRAMRALERIQTLQPLVEIRGAP